MAAPLTTRESLHADADARWNAGELVWIDDILTPVEDEPAFESSRPARVLARARRLAEASG